MDPPPQRRNGQQSKEPRHFDLSQPRRKYRATDLAAGEERLSEHHPILGPMLEAMDRRERALQLLKSIRNGVEKAEEWVANRMESSQATVSRLESGEIDPHLSTVERYAVSLGMRVNWQLLNGRNEVVLDLLSEDMLDQEALANLAGELAELEDD
jgi:transcriptional regulator with XRE-family HTH domain